ncbi:hypothetical protein B0H13DRAFT_2332691 [Mycena leptocephala]|nr:hypothetical protein B0H13DRAFT_2332691 [Mycena leptocephala]
MLARLHSRLPRRALLHTTPSLRTLYDPASEPREEELVDLEAETGKDVRVVVLEKSGEVWAHILSGAVIEPSALDALLLGWRSGEYDEVRRMRFSPRTKSARFEPGVAFRARAMLLAEGAHGSLSKQAITMYGLH